MQFIDNHISKIFEALRPLRVMRQNTAVQHVRIRQHHIRALADGSARILRSIAIVRERLDIGIHRVDRSLEFVQLVFGERLRRKQVHRASAGITAEYGSEPEGYSKAFCRWPSV